MTSQNGCPKTYTNLLSESYSVSWGKGIAIAMRVTREIKKNFGPEKRDLEFDKFLSILESATIPAHLIPKINEQISEYLTGKKGDGEFYKRFAPPLAYFPEDSAMIAARLAAESLREQAADKTIGLDEALFRVLSSWNEYGNANGNFLQKFFDRHDIILEPEN
jgi:hypothetical protein